MGSEQEVIQLHKWEYDIDTIPKDANLKDGKREIPMVGCN